MKIQSYIVLGVVTFTVVVAYLLFLLHFLFIFCVINAQGGGHIHNDFTVD